MQPVSDKPLPHGGDLDAARRRFPDAPEPWIDLSTGINPVPYPIRPPPPEGWARLPFASEMDGLRAAAAARYGAKDPDMIVAAPGAQALIQVIPRLFESGRVSVLSPTYGEHRAAWEREGHEVAEVNDPEESEADILVVVNPNNPTGFMNPPGDLRRIAGTLASRQGFLVVDEAFMDVMEPGASLAPSLPPRTIVLRSLGKAYGLAGIRLGFAIADRETAGALSARLGPWPVSGPALLVGRQALGDDSWIAGTRARLARDAERLDQMLGAAGYTLLGGTPLFRLVSRTGAHKAAEALGRNGIHVRQFGEHPTWLRFGLPGYEGAWQRLEAALREVASQA